MSRKAIILIVLGSVSGVIATAILLPIYIRARTTPAMNACVNNLRQIDGAKQQWALEYKKTTNDVPTMEDIRPYVGRGTEGEIPHCPLGGIYKIGRIGEPPSCSVDGSLE